MMVNNRLSKSLIVIFASLLCLCSITVQAQETYERDIQSVVFVPKGQWIAGFSINYSQSNQNKYQFLILEGISGDTYTFKASPMVAYAIKNDMAAGAKFSYSRSLTKLENASIVLDSETDYSLENFYSLAHNYYGTLIFRNYFSLGKSRRFGIFNEIQLQLGGGQSLLTQGRGSNVVGAYERNIAFNIGLAPGMAIFLNNYSALEVNIGVLGFNYKHTKQINNQIYVSDRKSKSANFRINLLSVAFGMAFYL